MQGPETKARGEEVVEEVARQLRPLYDRGVRVSHVEMDPSDYLAVQRVDGVIYDYGASVHLRTVLGPQAGISVPVLVVEGKGIRVVAR